jgi:predicted transposase YdaD
MSLHYQNYTSKKFVGSYARVFYPLREEGKEGRREGRKEGRKEGTKEGSKKGRKTTGGN